MPIRLNLLAEAQAAEELRRRDPVKRAGWVGVFLVFLMLAWSSSLQLKAMRAKGELSRIEAQLAANTNDYRHVIESQRATADSFQKMAALRQLATNRFLSGVLLNALQRTTVEDVQLTRLRTEQAYVLTDATKSRTTDDNRTIPGHPASSTEKITLMLDGIDSSLSPGEQVNRFREVLATNAYFREALAKTNAISLKNLSAPQISSTAGKACVLFTLECRYPDKTR
jgi:hypothetical protein